MAEKAILYDATKCIACRACQVACKQWNELPAEKTTCRGTYENPADLSADTWMKIKFKESDTGLGWLFSRQACMHCTDAACVQVCPSGALYHHELGFVAYDKDKCSGCGYCVEHCPFNIPRLEGSVWGSQKASKCLFCQDRVENGEKPACVAACPTGALDFGDRGAMLDKAHQRLEKIRWEHPNACIYGENELGGLHVLYVLDDSPEAYGLPTNPRRPEDIYALKAILHHVGWGFGILAIVGIGFVHLIAKRKIKVKKH